MGLHERMINRISRVGPCRQYFQGVLISEIGFAKALKQSLCSLFGDLAKDPQGLVVVLSGGGFFSTLLMVQTNSPPLNRTGLR